MNHGTSTITTYKNRLIAALHSTHWNKSKAAEIMQWSRMTMYRKIVKYDLSPQGPQADADEKAAS